MASVNESRPLPELIGGLANDISTLFRKEIELAKAETSEKVTQVIGGVEMLLAGAVLALGALGVLLAAAVSGLAALLRSWGMGEAGANALSSLIVGVIVAGIAFVLVNRGLKTLKGNNLQLERTAHSLGRDADMVKERL
jgi:hypothetical protein